MNRNILKIIGIAMLLFTSLAWALILEISEIARYICIISGQEFTMRWYDFANGGSIVFIIISYVISFYVIYNGFIKK